MDLNQWLGVTMPESLGLTASIATVKAEPRTVPTTEYFVSLHTRAFLVVWDPRTWGAPKGLFGHMGPWD